MFALLLLAHTVQAAGNEVSVSLSTLSTPYDHWDYLSGRDGLRGWGLRGGYGLGDHTTIVLGWQHGADGGDLYAGSDEEQDLRMALYTNRFSLGPKLDIQPLTWLHPYATAQATVLWGALKMDDDLQDDENPNQIRENGLAPGGLAALGLDFIPARVDRTVRPAMSLELGYALTVPLELGDLGEIPFRGFYVDWGVGVRF